MTTTLEELANLTVAHLTTCGESINRVAKTRSWDQTRRWTFRIDKSPTLYKKKKKKRIAIHITGEDDEESKEQEKSKTIQRTYILEVPLPTPSDFDFQTLTMIYRLDGIVTTSSIDETKYVLPANWNEGFGPVFSEFSTDLMKARLIKVDQCFPRSIYCSKKLDRLLDDPKYPKMFSRNLLEKSRFLWYNIQEQAQLFSDPTRSKKTYGKEFDGKAKLTELATAASNSSCGTINGIEWTASKEVKKPIFPPDPHPNSDQAPLSLPRSPRPLNSFAYVLYCGQRDKGSILSKLPIFLMQKIYVEHVRGWYLQHINYNGIFASVVAQVDFPKYRGNINVNMMPIVLGNSWSIPLELQPYLPLLAACTINREEWGKVGYLTIHESEVIEDQTSHRRKGMHTETPGTVFFDPLTYEVKNPSKWSPQSHAPLTVAWGRGQYHAGCSTTCEYQGGLYMASNVAASTRVWNCEIKNPNDIVSEHGDLEHIRSFFDKGCFLRPGELCWMTDKTPHESVPLAKGTKRQYFRLVTSEVTAWYENHSTKNPLGIVPPKNVTILKGSKFAEEEKKQENEEGE